MHLGKCCLLTLLFFACSSEPLRSADKARTGEGGEATAQRSCTQWEGEPSYLSAGDAFARELGVQVTSCGFELERFGEQAALCCESLGQRRRCLVEALERCTPARYTEVFSTVEGDPIVRDYFVLPTERSCELVELQDSSRDQFRGPGDPITQRHCSGASFAPPADQAVASCPRLRLEGCVP